MTSSSDDQPLQLRLLESAGPEQTEAIGAALVTDLGPGAVVLVSGEVGAGKTTLVRGAVRALGHPGRVTSPTFAIGHRYDGAHPPVSHLDLYRLGEAGLAAEDPALLADYLRDDAIAFVEWPEAAGEGGVDGMRAVALHVHLRHTGGDTRSVEISGG